MTQATLAPIVKTEFARRFTRSGVTQHRECWGARTADGVWSFDREDSPGTPWLVYHQPSVADGMLPTPVTMLSSLRSCRGYVACGAADADLARLHAHVRGEHAERRDPACGKC
jgi:hypothetical protein